MFIPSIILKSFLLYAVLAVSTVYANNYKQIDVLAIHSYHQEYEWTASQYEAFKNRLKSNLPEYNINFSTEYLDTKHIHPSKKYQKEFLNYLSAKYKNNLPDLIYVTDDNSLKFILFDEKKLSWNIPVIFSGINNTNIVMRSATHTLAGIFEHKDIQSSILLAKQLEPDSSQIVFLGDDGTTDNAIKEMISKSQYRTENLKLIHISDSKLDTLIEKLNTNKQGVVIITTVGGVHDSDGNHLELQKIIKALTGTGRKILVMEDAYLYPGVLGGHVTSGRIQGESAANIATRRITGELSKNYKHENQIISEFVLSWPDMQRFGIDLSDSKYNKAKIIHKPLPFLERNPGLVMWLLWLVITLFMALFGFIWNAKRKNRLLKEQYTDAVTGLPNRIRLLRDVNQSDFPFLAIVDINNFKTINNLYGLKVGDDLLNLFAKKLRLYIKDYYQVYRVGGNQFAILNKKKLAQAQFDGYIKKLLRDNQNNTYNLGSIEVSLTLTAGISRNETEFLVPMAEQALQQAKKTNKDYFIIDNIKKDAEQYHKNLLWAKKVNTSILEERIVPYFQPITDNKTGERIKFEALVRMIDEDGSVISPFFFLDAAKSTRQYSTLSKIMIDKSCQAINGRDINISINFTVDDIRNEKTIRFFKEKLNEYQVADKIIIELIESEGIENYTEVAEFIAEIKKLGCRVAIDDFGTGYSNFTHLIHLNVDYLKIDGSIIQNILHDKNSEIVAKTLVEFAGQLGIETIAEFVDSQEILDKVTAMGIDYSQGYFLGKPESTLPV